MLYSLENEELLVQVRGHGAELRSTIGAHPAFRCPIVPGETLEDCYTGASGCQKKAAPRSSASNPGTATPTMPTSTANLQKKPARRSSRRAGRSMRNIRLPSEKNEIEVLEPY